MDDEEIINFGEAMYQVYIESIFSIINEQEIIRKLNNIFEDYIVVSGLQHEMIEMLVEEYYFENIKSFKNSLLTTLEENVEEATKNLVIRVENDSNDKDRALDYFEKMINANRFYNYIQKSFEEINNDFLREFISKLINRFERLDSNIEEIIRYDIGNDVKKYLETIAENFYDCFRNKMNAVNQSIYQNTETEINNFMEVKPSQETKHTPSIDEMNEYIQLFGYTIKQKDNKIIIEKNNNAKVSYEVIPVKNGFMSKGNEKTGIIYDNNIITFYDAYRHNKVEFDISTHSIKIQPQNKEYENSIYEIKCNNGEIEILYAEKVLNDPVKQSIVINDIKNKYPNIFNKLLENQKIASTLNEIQKQSDQQELYTKDELGIKKVENNYEELQKRMFIVGYKLEEVDGVLYAINMKTKSRDKLISDGFGLRLKSNPKALCVVPNLTIIHKGKIVNNYLSIYINNHQDLLVTPNFNHFYFGNLFEINIDENGIKYASDKMSDDEIEKYLTENYPNILTYINSNVKWNNFSIPKEKSVDSSKFKSIEPKKEMQQKEEPTIDELLAKIAQLEKENEFLKRQNQQLIQSYQQIQNDAPML